HCYECLLVFVRPCIFRTIHIYLPPFSFLLGSNGWGILHQLLTGRWFRLFFWSGYACFLVTINLCLDAFRFGVTFFTCSLFLNLL
ncbi:unnamed protein product, partial [Callosobruchus maculatus]